MSDTLNKNQVFLTSKQLRERYGGLSQQWLWRHQNDESGFPKPIRIQGRRFWKLKEIETFEKSLASK